MINYADLVLGADTSGLLKAQRDLKGVRDEGARTEQGITGSMGKVSKGFSNAAIAASKFAAGAAAAVAASVGIGQAVGVIRQFEGSMSQVAAITGATGAELAALRDIAKELGSTTEFSAAQAADGLRFLGMAGFSAAESMKAIPAVLDLATASSMGLAESADIASNVLSGFGLAADDAAQVADVLAAASSRANTSVSQLGNAMSTVAPISAALGIDLADTAAAIGVLSDAGIQGERAGTALRGVLASLAGPTDAATDALAQYGITAAQVNPETQSLTEIFGLLAERGLSTADAMTIFGREAASGALVLAEASTRVGEFGEELRGAEGAASDMASIMRDNLGGAANTLMSSVQGLAIALGEAGLTAVLIAGLDAVTAMVRGLTRLVEIGGGVIEWVTSFGTFEATMRNVQAATDTTNLAIADTLAQVNALSVAEMGGRQVSLDYASAKLEQARASYAAADALRQENIEQIKASEEYQDLIARQMRLNETISMLQDILSESPSQAALDMMEFMRDPTDPNNLDGFVVQLERSLEKLRETVAQQELMTSAAGETTAEMESALRQIELYEAAIAAAKGETVILGAETSNAADTTAALARLSGQVDFGNAVSSAQSLADWLGISLSRAMALAATTPAMADEDLLMSQAVIPDANARAAQREAVENFERMSAAMNRVGGSARSAGKAVSDAEKEVEKLNDEISRLEDAADPTRKFRREMEQLDTLLENGLSDGAYAQAVRELNEELVESTPILSSVNDAFGQMVDYMFDGFKDGMRGILDIFVNTLKQMAATALKNRITIGLGLGVTGGAGAAAASVPGGGGISSLFGGGGFLGLGGGAGSLFGGAGLLGMGGGSGFLGLGAGSGLATALGGGAFGAAASVALPILGVGLAVAGLFKKTEVLVAEGVRARIDGASLELDSYEKTKTNNGFGMSSGFDREFERLDDAVQSAVGARLDATIDALGAFGLGTDLTGFQFSKRTEIKDGETFEGESEEVIREALNAAVEYLAEGALELYQQAGEGLSDTLTRLSTAIQVVNPLVDRLGNHMLDMSLDGAAAASALIEAAGGLEAFAAETAFVFENFTLDAEKAHIAADELGIQMRALGLDTIPATHAAFMELVNAQDLATEGGREMYAALLDIAPLFVQVKGTAQEAADAAANELVPALVEVDDTASDAAAAARELAAQQREQESLLLQIARMTGNVAYIREQERNAVMDIHKPLIDYIHLLEDQAAALEDAVDAARAVLNTAQSNLDIAESALDAATDALTRAFDAAREDVEASYDLSIQALQDLRQGLLDDLQNASDALDGATQDLRDAFAAEADRINQIYDDRIAAEQAVLETLNQAVDVAAQNLEDARGLFDRSFAAEADRITADAQAQIDALNTMAEATAEANAAATDAAREQVSLLEGILSSLDRALDSRRALTDAETMMRLGQAQGFLRNAIAEGGTTDQDGLSRALATLADPEPTLFKSFEDFAFDYKVNTNLMEELQGLTEGGLTTAEQQLALAQAQARADDQRTRDQIRAIEKQRDDELAALEALRNEVLGVDTSVVDVSTAIDALTTAQDALVSAEDAAAETTRLIEYLEGRRQWELEQNAANLEAILGGGSVKSIEDAIVAYYDAQEAFNIAQAAATDAALNDIDRQIQELERDRALEIQALEDQYNALLGIDTSVQSVADAIAGFTAASQNVANAVQAVADAQAALDAAQNAVDNSPTGGGGITSGMSSAEKRLYSILSALEGAEGAALLGSAAFGQFSENNMNALLTNAGVSALTGAAADVAAAYTAELGRNVDVSGLQFYVDALASGGIDLAGLAAQLASSTEAITGVIPGFAIPGVSTGGGGSSGGSSSGGGGSSGGGSSGGSTGDGGMPEGWERPNGVVAALFGTYGVPWSDSKYNRWLDNYADRNELYGGYSGFQDAWMAAFEDDFGKVPSYRSGTDYHPGGWARLHENEMVNLPRGTGVSTASEVRETVQTAKEQLEILKEMNARMREEQTQMRRQNDLLRLQYEKMMAG